MESSGEHQSSAQSIPARLQAATDELLALAGAVRIAHFTEIDYDDTMAFVAEGVRGDIMAITRLVRSALLPELSK